MRTLTSAEVGFLARCFVLGLIIGAAIAWVWPWPA